MKSRRLVLLCLGLYMAALGAWLLLAPQTDWLWREFATLRFDGVSKAAIVRLLAICAARAAPFVVLGALCVPAVALPWRAVADPSVPVRWLGAAVTLVNACLALAVALLLVGVVRGAANGAVWSAPGLLTLLGCVFGVSLGDVLARRGFNLLKALLLRLLWLTVIASVLVQLFAYAALAGSASTAPRASITSAQKRAIVGQIRGHNPLHVEEQQTTALVLSVPQLRALLSWAALLVDRDARVDVHAGDGALIWRTAVALPAVFGRRAVLNIGGELSGSVTSGELVAERCVLQLGSLSARAWVCRAMLRTVLDAARDDRTFGSLLAVLHVVQVDADGARAIYGRMVLDANMRQVLQRLIGPDPEVRAAVVAQLALLRVLVRGQAPQQDAFGKLLRDAFQLARVRSRAGDPIAENQGAILALASVFGIAGVATLAGLPPIADGRQLEQAQGVLRLRGRSDWVKHFLVSAGLTQIATAVVSDAAGLLKEELDAGGGSGFSFGDLLADRAGTLFGETAVRSDVSARALQDRIVDAYRVDDFLPDGRDLPEDLQDAVLTARYGGVGGARYRAVVATIEARLRGCAAYQLR